MSALLRHVEALWPRFAWLPPLPFLAYGLFVALRDYFGGMYGRASSVFGAVPSLHAAYPWLVVLATWRELGALGRALTLGFSASMCFAAVYLDHHWVLDVVAGLALAGTCWALVRAIEARAGSAPPDALAPIGATRSPG